MFFQLYKTRLKCLFRNRESMFWCYLFPILLVTFFHFAFNNIWKIDDFKTIPIAYVSEDSSGKELKEIMISAKMKNDVKMFDITRCDEAKAKILLENGKINAYITGNDKPVIHLKENSMNVTITKNFLDNYRQMAAAVKNILKENPNAAQEGLLDDVMHYDEFVKDVRTGNKPQTLLVYYYALLAYTCMFAANWALDEVVNIQADLSARGARLNVTPTNKMKLFFCNMLAAFTAHMGSLVLMFLYLRYFNNIDFGNNLVYVFGICVLGSFCGLAVGGTIGIWVKKKAEVKEAILMVVTLGGGFLAGMMAHQIKYVIAQKFPLLGYINPVNLIADGLYSLYYYDTYHRFYLDAVLLCVITAVMFLASYVGIRRKNYASL